MTKIDREFTLSLPVNDTGELFEHMDGVWGKFTHNERGNIGGVHDSEIPFIAEEWISTCGVAVKGAEIIRTFIETGTLTPNVEAVETYRILSNVLGGKTSREKLALIFQAKRAFENLLDQSLPVDQVDINAAQLIVSKLDKYYQPREISAPITEN